MTFRNYFLHSDDGTKVGEVYVETYADATGLFLPLDTDEVKLVEADGTENTVTS